MAGCRKSHEIVDQCIYFQMFSIAARGLIASFPRRCCLLTIFQRLRNSISQSLEMWILCCSDDQSPSTLAPIESFIFSPSGFTEPLWNFEAYKVFS